LDKFWTSSVAQRPLFLAARSSRITASVPDATESLLFRALSQSHPPGKARG
jgi:hypothetical protein